MTAIPPDPPAQSRQGPENDQGSNQIVRFPDGTERYAPHVQGTYVGTWKPPQLTFDIDGTQLPAAFAIGQLLAEREWLREQLDLFQTQLADLRAGISKE